MSAFCSLKSTLSRHVSLRVKTGHSFAAADPVRIDELLTGEIGNERQLELADGRKLNVNIGGCSMSNLGSVPVYDDSQLPSPELERLHPDWRPVADMIVAGKFRAAERTLEALTASHATSGSFYLIRAIGRNTIYGGSGNDTIRFSRGGGVAYGGSGNDMITAQNRNVQITAFGQGGNDNIWGGNKADRLYGGAGNDRLHGGAGNDRIHGGRGNDLLNDGDGRDVVIGGAGQDKFEMTVGYRDDGDNDLLSLGSRYELRSERHFASIDYWFSVNGWLDGRYV